MIEFSVSDVTGKHRFRRRKPQITISSARLRFKEEILSIIVRCYVSLIPWNLCNLMESCASALPRCSSFIRFVIFSFLVNLSKRCRFELHVNVSTNLTYPAARFPRSESLARTGGSQHILFSVIHGRLHFCLGTRHSSSAGKMIDGYSSGGLG